jgi:16S rRNA (uracil1498-N3)-methyltransferase
MSGRVLRVLVENLHAGQTDLSGPEAHHLANVLRVKPGAHIEAFDGRGNVASGTVAKVDRQVVTVHLGEPEPAMSEAPLRVRLAVALLKGDKLSDVVRQCTELGAAEFQLVVTHHADATSISPARLTRLRRVAEEAARQSGRATVPAVCDPVRLDAFTWQGLALVAHPEAGQSLADAWPSAMVASGDASPAAVTVVTGPEGGFSEAEVAELEARGARGVSFGPRILRAETAPVALAAALLLPGGR